MKFSKFVATYKNVIPLVVCIPFVIYILALLIKCALPVPILKSNSIGVLNHPNKQIEKIEKEPVKVVINTNAYQESENVQEEKEPELIMYFDEDDVIALAKVLYNECRGIPSTTEKACVAWTVCNRVDNGYWGDTFIDVVSYPNAFAYWYDTPIREELYDLAEDILIRWNKEKNGIEDVGRVLPQDYVFFAGDGEHNYFRNKFSGDYDVWDYDYTNSGLRNPYPD